MGSKLSLILSIPFLLQIMLFCGDLYILEATHSQLDALANTVSIKISQSGSISDSIKEYVSDMASASISCSNGCSGYIGDIITFTLYKKYKPIVISSDEIYISVTRSTVIGYYS